MKLTYFRTQNLRYCKVLISMLFLPCPTLSTLFFNRRDKEGMPGLGVQMTGLDPGFPPRRSWGKVLKLSFSIHDTVGVRIKENTMCLVQYLNKCQFFPTLHPMPTA